MASVSGQALIGEVPRGFQSHISKGGIFSAGLGHVGAPPAFAATRFCSTPTSVGQMARSVKCVGSSGRQLEGAALAQQLHNYYSLHQM